MRELIPFLKLYRSHWLGLFLGIFLSFLTLLCAIGLLTLSGWFISASAIAGISAISHFNYMLPAAAVRGFSIARTAGRWGERVVSHNATFKLLANLRVFFFHKLTPLIPGKIANLRDADILNRLVADVDAMDHVYLRLLSPLVVGLFAALTISGFLYWFDAKVGIALGTILLSILIFFPIIFYFLGKPYGQAITQIKSQFRIALLDIIQGYSELNIFGALNSYQDKAKKEQQALLIMQRKMAIITGFANALLLLINGLTLILMLWLVADGVGGQAPNALIAMVAFATMASFELLMPVAGAFQYLSQTLTSAKRLNEIIQAKPETVFDPNGYDRCAIGKIDIHNISYCYQNSAQKALENISMSIQAGEKIALIGQTGCGKSTLLQLITRSWDPSIGQINIDDISLTQWQEAALRKSIAVVSQRVDIFNGPLRQNLSIAKSDVTDDELIKILNDLDLTHLLDGVGLDTWLGDGGRVLSGGERRRIGIARAILLDAPILLLDEPTEGLDVNTEQKILSLLFDHCKNKTVLFITHRLVALNEFDRLVLMDNGKIVEQGSHKELLAKQGHYAQLLRLI